MSHDDDVRFAIDIENKRALWDILGNFEDRLSVLDRSPMDEVKNLINSLQEVVEWAEEYPNVLIELQDKTKLLEIARKFIKDNNLADEFNRIANKKM